MVVIDTGPLVSIFDESEPSHETCIKTLKEIKRPPLTTWSVLTEVFYFLKGWQKGQSELWDFISSGGLVISDIPASYHSHLKELMRKYSDIPMDLADATVVVLAEIHNIRTVFTLDRRDFSLYRPKHCRGFEIIPKK